MNHTASFRKTSFLSWSDINKQFKRKCDVKMAAPSNGSGNLVEEFEESFQVRFNDVMKTVFKVFK